MDSDMIAALCLFYYDCWNLHLYVCSFQIVFQNIKNIFINIKFFYPNTFSVISKEDYSILIKWLS